MAHGSSSVRVLVIESSQWNWYTSILWSICVCSGRCEVSGKSQIWTPRQQFNYLQQLWTFSMQYQYRTVLLVHSRSTYKSDRYADLCTPCCFLPLRSTHSAIMHLMSIISVQVTQNFLSWLRYKLIYNFLTVTVIFQLNVTYFRLLMPLYQ